MKYLSILFLFSIALVAAAVDDVNNQYVVTNLTETANGITAYMKYTGSDDYYLKPKSLICKNLKLEVKFDGDSELHVAILDNEAHRFSLPEEHPFPHTKELPAITDRKYTVRVAQIDDKFSFAVIRKSTQEVIFDTKDFDFVYSDLSLKFGVRLPTRYLYGLGERRADYLYKAGTYSIFSIDQSRVDYKEPGQQLYGTHPVYLMREPSKNWHMVLFRNVNAMDFTYDGDRGLNFTTIGGILEWKFFLGDTNPENAIRQYHHYSNGIALTPFWAHGWHQSRWGYQNFSVLKAVVDNCTKFDLPLDTLWSDIDYLDQYQDFTIAPHFEAENLTKLIKNTTGLHWVPILDPGIAIGNNPAYQQGLRDDIFINSPNTGEPLIAKVWPGLVHYPDFANPKAVDYWGYFCEYLHTQAPYSGLWIDMNELSNFCNGECNQQSFEGISSEDLPYVPSGGNLEHLTLSLGATHYGGYTELDYHGLNGFLEGVATRKAFIERLNITLPFILSRSTAIGTAAINQHWTGDNWSNYDFLAFSLPELFGNQLYGHALCGPDICGFNNDTNPLLCTYWQQLAVIYPFARNHNNIENIDQQPWDMGPTLLETTRLALKLRYAIVKWQYSIFVRNAGAGTTFRPMFYEFPEDDYLLSLESQVLLGGELLAVPCLHEPKNISDTEREECRENAYFPAASKFYDFLNGTSVHDYADEAQNISVPVPVNATLPLFLRAGSIIHTQNATGVKNTFFLDSNFSLTIALLQVDDTTYTATGVMLGVSNFTDERNLVDKCTGDVNCLVAINVTGKVNNGGLDVTISFTPLNDQTTEFEEIIINSFTLHGVKTVPCKIRDKTCNSDFSATFDQPTKVTKTAKVEHTITKKNKSHSSFRHTA